MTLDNATVLKTLTEQRSVARQQFQEMSGQIQDLQAQILKLDGAIDVLTQIEETNNPKNEEPEVEPEEPTTDE
tara:strand:- start:469 stop:687 length:219 start_codon:yes stop_codon:yes gene_type:complete